MKERRSHLFSLGVALLALGLLALTAASAGAAPPKGKHYAITMMMADPTTGELEAVPACLSFTAGEMCTESNECGPWGFTVKQRHRNEWHGTLEFSDDFGNLIRVEARGITERKGARSSIGGTFMFTIEGQEFNAGFGGTRTTRAECQEFGLSDD
jgi:hypothetical protein